MTSPDQEVTVTEPPPSIPGPVRFVLALLRKVFKDPVVYGRLRAIEWPRGLGIIVGLSAALYVVAMMITVLGPWLRTQLALEAYGGEGSAPVGLLWAVLGLIYFSLALFQTGTLHAVWWVRVLGLIVSFVALTRAGSMGDHRSAVGQFGILLACFAVLVVLQALRWRRAFVWWEFPVVLGVFAVALLSASSVLHYSRALVTGAEVQFASLAVAHLAFLVAPVAMVSGFAIAQLAFATVVSTVDLGRRELPRWLILLAMVALLGWRLVAEVAPLIFGTSWQPAQLAWSAGLVVAAALAWLLLDRLADRRQAGSTKIVDLSEDLKQVTNPVAVAVTGLSLLIPLIIWPLLYLTQVADVAEVNVKPLTAVVAAASAVQSADDTVIMVLVGVALFAVALRLALRGDRGKAELVGIIALIQISTALSSLRFSTAYLGLWCVVVLTAVTIVLTVRRRLSTRRIEALLVATGLATVLSTRELFADPLNALFGGSAALFLSLLWALLTGGDEANGESSRFPRPARVCLMLASALFGMAVLAFKNVSSELTSETSTLEVRNAFGDGLFGGSLLLGAVIAIILSIIRDDDIGASEELEAIQVYRPGDTVAEPPSGAPPVR